MVSDSVIFKHDRQFKEIFISVFNVQQSNSNWVIKFWTKLGTDET